MGWWVAPQLIAASHPLVTEQPAETEHLHTWHQGLKRIASTQKAGDRPRFVSKSLGRLVVFRGGEFNLIAGDVKKYIVNSIGHRSFHPK